MRVLVKAVFLPEMSRRQPACQTLEYLPTATKLAKKLTKVTARNSRPNNQSGIKKAKSPVGDSASRVRAKQVRG
jgi:hypothetical protein